MDLDVKVISSALLASCNTIHFKFIAIFSVTMCGGRGLGKKMIDELLRNASEELDAYVVQHDVVKHDVIRDIFCLFLTASEIYEMQRAFSFMLGDDGSKCRNGKTGLVFTLRDTLKNIKRDFLAASQKMRLMCGNQCF